MDEIKNVQNIKMQMLTGKDKDCDETMEEYAI